MSDALFSPFAFVRINLKLPKLITLNEYDSVCKRHAQKIDIEAAKTIVSNYAKTAHGGAGKGTVATRTTNLETAIRLAVEASQKDLTRPVSAKGFERAQSAREGDQIWNPKLGVGKLVSREGDFGLVQLPNKQKTKSRFALEYWYTLNEKSDSAADRTLQKGARAFFSLLSLKALERQNRISELNNQF